MNTTLVVGSGITGLSAAVFLARAGENVEVWEKSSVDGGLLAPVRFQGIPCDRGSHRVHPESHPLLRELTESVGWLERKREGLLVFGGRSMSYPPKPVAFLRGLGGRAALSMAWGFVTRPGQVAAFKSWEKDRGELPERDIGFEEFVVSRVGRAAYERFYRPYVEKVWGVDPGEISRTVAKQRVSTSAPLTTFRRALSRTAVVDRSFLYPRDGIGSLIESLKTMAVEAGASFKTHQLCDSKTDFGNFDRVFYSGHLADLVPESGLQHRGLYVVYLALPKGFVRDHDTWYAPEEKYWFGRVSQPSRFSPSLTADQGDVLCVEIPEGRWGRGQDFTQSLDTLLEQLVDAGIVSEHCPLLDATQIWIPRVYPVYHRGWFAQWKKALDDLGDLGEILPIGRQGLFLHCNMDHCVHIAWEAVQHAQSSGSAASWRARCADFLDLRVRD